MEENILSVKTSREFLNAVANGEEKSITIEITPDNEQDLIEMEETTPDDNNLYAKEDEGGNVIPLHYDVICLYSGRSPKGAHILVEIESESSYMLVDDDEKPVYYEVDGQPYFVENIEYVFGKIRECELTTEKKATQAAEGPVMKCLAVRQPWAQLIVTGIKDIECRDAMPAPKTPKVFIAASGTKLKWEELGEEVQSIYTKYEKKGVLPAYNDLPTKCIVGFVDIVKASFDPVDSPWGSDWDGMKYTLRNAEELDEPLYGKNKATPYFYNVEGYDEQHLPASHKVKLD